MKHEISHYLSKVMGWVWLLSFMVGSLISLAWLVKMFLKMIGVI